MKLVHTTFEANRESILGEGVCVRYSKGAYRRVWFHKPFLAKWAVKHVVRRHRGKARDVIHLSVNIPDRWLKRFKDGVYFAEVDIPPAHIESVRGAV